MYLQSSSRLLAEAQSPQRGTSGGHGAVGEQTRRGLKGIGTERKMAAQRAEHCTASGARRFASNSVNCVPFLPVLHVRNTAWQKSRRFFFFFFFRRDVWT